MGILAVEIVLVGIATLLVLAIAGVYLRRRMIGHNSDVVLCGFRPSPQSRWRPGLLRMSANTLSVFPLFGLTALPVHTWMRRSLDVPGTEALDAEGGLSTLLGQNALRVVGHGITESGTRVDLNIALSRSSYTALRYWVEASPPSDRPLNG
ncbi:MAG: DUF2550 family protein [Mobilicoccus sp.]|nr:DUF2550 family protein [Mobilicoccus sp.]